jgi:hypothetical protein
LRHERRLMVGPPDGRHSTIWKFIAQKSDVYFRTSMYGSDAKVSLHEDGKCHWACDSPWIRKDPDHRRNKDCFIREWHLSRPDGHVLQHVFRVEIPETELRRVAIDRKDLAKVRWLDAPPQGLSVMLGCYIASNSYGDPAFSASLPHHHLFSLPLADGRWFALLIQLLLLDKERIEQLRQQMQAQARAAGFAPDPIHRVCVSPPLNEGCANGLIEACLV